MQFETAVIVPNFNGISHLKECLTSLRDQSYKKHKIILVDDGSRDGSAIFVKKNFPEVEVMEFKKNAGFTPAINEGIKFAINKYSPKYIALLNNDARADRFWLEKLVVCIEKDGKAATVASNMLFYDNPEIINSQGGTCNFIGLGEDINYKKNKKNISFFKKEALSPCFGAALISAEKLEKIGLPDQRYFAYYEDLDWGLRANVIGYKIIFEKDAVVYHKGSASFKNNEFKKVYLCVRNSLCTVIKNYETKNLIRVLPLILGYYCQFLVGQISRLKRKKICRELKFFAIPAMAICWNVFNLRTTLKLRKEIQKKRGIKDREIFDNYFLK